MIVLAALLAPAVLPLQNSASADTDLCDMTAPEPMEPAGTMGGVGALHTTSSDSDGLPEGEVCNHPIRQDERADCLARAFVEDPAKDAVLAGPISMMGYATWNPTRIHVGIGTSEATVQHSTNLDKTTWKATMDTRLVPDGARTLWAWASENDSCRPVRTNLGVHIENAPKVSIHTPSVGDGIHGTVVLAGEAKDLWPGVQAVHVRVDALPWREATLTVISESRVGWHVEWDSWEVSDGAHVIEAIADDGEFLSAPARVEFYLNNDPPAAYRHPRSEPDDDGDGIGDVFAAAYALVETATDLDRDRLANLEEFLWDTIPVPSTAFAGGSLVLFPNAPDYDRDQLADGDEAAYWIRRGGLETWEPQAGLVQFKHPGAFLDTDDDGVPNMHDPDSDNDGLLDGVEILVGTYPEHQDSDCAAWASQCPPSSIYIDGTVPSSNSSKPSRIGTGTHAVFAFDARDHDTQAKTTSDSGGRWTGALRGVHLVEGRFGDAYSFDGTAHIEVAEANGLPMQQIAILSWIRPEFRLGSDSRAPFVAWNTTAPSGFRLAHEGGRLLFAAAGEEGTWHEASHELALDAGEWRHVAGTFDGVSLKLYLDGELVAQETFRGKIAIPASPMILGAHGDIGFAGAMDEVRLYARALAPPVAPRAHPSLMNAYVPGAGAIASFAVAAWSLDDEDEWRTWPGLLWDATGNGYDLDRFGVTRVASKGPKYGEAYSFVRGSRLSLPGPLPLSPASFTFAAWVRPDEQPTEPMTVMSQNGAASSCGVTFGLYVDEHLRPVLGMRASGRGWTDVVADYSIGIGEWSHLAASHDGANARLFVNGFEVAKEPITMPSADCASTFSVGRLEETFVEQARETIRYSWYWQGAIDDVQVYGRGHTQSVVQEFAKRPFEPATLMEGRGEAEPRPSALTELESLMWHPYVHILDQTWHDDTTGTGDNFPDSDEFAYWRNRVDLDPNGRGWMLDLDDDGITNLLDPDSDGDGCLDGDEHLHFGTDPADPMDCSLDRYGFVDTVNRNDPRNEDLEELHPVNEEYLRKKQRDVSSRLTSVAEFNETAFADYLRDEIDMALNVATQDTVLNAPTRRVARTLLDIIRPDRVISCARGTAEDGAEIVFDTLAEALGWGALELVATVNRTIEDPTTVAPDAPPCLAGLVDPAEVLAAAGELVEELAQTVRERLPAELSPDVEETLERLRATLEDALRVDSEQLGNVTLQAVSSVNGTAEIALPPLASLDPIAFHPDFLRGRVEPLPLLGPTLYEALRILEDEVGVPLIELVDATHYNIVYRTSEGDLRPVRDLVVGQEHLVNLTGDERPDAAVSLTYGTAAVPTGGVGGGRDVPTFSFVKLDPSSVLEGAIYLLYQYPGTPHVAGFGLEPVASDAGQLPQYFQATLRQAAFDDGPPLLDLVLVKEDETMSRALVGVVPVNMSAEGKPVAPGRTLSLELEIGSVGSKAEFLVSLTRTAGLEEVDLRWRAESAGPVRAQYLDENGSRRFGLELNAPAAPAAFDIVKRSWPDLSLANFATNSSGNIHLGPLQVAVLDTLGESTRLVSVNGTFGTEWQAAFDFSSLTATVTTRQTASHARAVLIESGASCLAPESGPHLVLVNRNDSICASLRLDVHSRWEVRPTDGGFVVDGTAAGEGPAAIHLLSATEEFHASLAELPGQHRLEASRSGADAWTLLWRAEGAIANLFAERVSGQEIVRIELEDVPTQLDAHLDARAGSLRVNAVHGAGPLEIVATRSGVAPYSHQHHLAGTPGAYSIRLPAFTHAEASIRLDGSAFVLLHAASPAPFEVELDATVSRKLHLGSDRLPGVMRFDAALASGSIVGRGGHVLERLKLDVSTATARLVLDAEQVPIDFDLAVDPAAALFSWESNTSLAGLTFTLLDGASHVPRLPASEQVVLASEGASRAARVEAKDIRTLRVSREDGVLEIIRDRLAPAPLDLVIVSGVDLLRLHAEGLPQRAAFVMEDLEWSYRGTSGSVIPAFEVRTTVKGVSRAWVAESAPDEVTLTFDSSRGGVALAAVHSGSVMPYTLIQAPIPSETTSGDRAFVALDGRDLPAETTVKVVLALGQVSVTTGSGPAPRSLRVGYTSDGSIQRPLDGGEHARIVESDRVARVSLLLNETSDFSFSASPARTDFELRWNGTTGDRKVASWTRPDASFAADFTALGGIQLAASTAPVGVAGGFDATADAPVIIHSVLVEDVQRAFAVTNVTTLEWMTLDIRHEGEILHDADRAVSFDAWSVPIGTAIPATQAASYILFGQGNLGTAHALHLDGARYLRANASGIAFEGEADEDMVYLFTTPGDRVLLAMDPRPPEMKAGWGAGVGPFLEIETAALVDRLDLDLATGVATLAARYSNVTGTAAFKQDLLGRLNFTASSRVAGIQIHHQNDGRAAADLLAGGIGAAVVRMDGDAEGEGDAGTDRFSLRLVDVGSAFLEGVGDTFSARYEGAGDPTRPTVFRVGTATMIGDLWTSTLPSSVRIEARQNSSEFLLEQATEPVLSGSRLVLRGPSGFTEARARETTALHAGAAGPGNTGFLEGAAAGVDLRGNGGWGYLDIRARDMPEGRLVWTTAPDSKSGNVSMEGARAIGSLRALLVPGAGVGTPVVRVPSCAVPACLRNDLDGEPATTRIEAPDFRAAVWDRSDSGIASVKLERALGTPPVEAHALLLTSTGALDVRLPEFHGPASLTMDASGRGHLTYAAGVPMPLAASYDEDGRYLDFAAATAPESFTLDADPASIAWQASGTADTLNVISTLDPPVHVSLAADRVPPAFHGEVHPGDCGVKEEFRFSLATESGLQLERARFLYSKTGAAPADEMGGDIPYGVDVRCEEGLPEISVNLDLLDDVRVARLACAGVDRITATSRETPYYAALGGGLVKGVVKLVDGTDVLEIFLVDGRASGEGHTVGYQLLRDPANRLDLWTLEYQPLFADLAGKPCIPPIEGRPVEFLKAVGGEKPGATLPGRLQVKLRAPDVDFAATGDVGSLAVQISVGAETEDDGGGAFEDGVALDVPVGFGFLDVVITQAGRPRPAPVLPETNQIIIITKPGHYYRKVKVVEVDDLAARFAASDCRLGLVYKGASNSFVYWREKEGKTRLTIQNLPSELNLSLKMSGAGSTGEVMNRDMIETFRHWQDGGDPKACGGTDRSGRASALRVQDIPGHKENWEFGFLKGAAGLLRLQPSGGPVGSVSFGFRENENAQRYLQIYAETASFRFEWDFDGDTHYDDMPTYFFGDTNGMRVTEFGVRGRWENVGLALGHLGIVYFDNFQVKAEVLVVPVPMMGQMPAVVVEIPFITINGKLGFAGIPWIEAWLANRWWSIPEAVLEARRR